MRRTVILLAVWLFCAGAAWPQSNYDLILRNGRIVDGSGNPWYVADVGIREGRIAAIGRLCGPDTSGCPAKHTLDASGLVVAPGFIDVHTHVEGNIRTRPTAENFLFDGVTSVITGNCGGSAVDLEQFFSELRRAGISINLGTLIGHNSVRREVMGTEQRDPTPEELAKMQALVERAMQQGAVGFSTGLLYIPGTFAKTPEVIALARAAAKHNGIYASHIRNEEDYLFESIQEALEVGRANGMPVEISHFKVANQKMWGLSERSIALVEKARAEGLDVTVDQYPYTAASTNLGVLLPSWALAGGQEKLNERLGEPATRGRIAEEAAAQMRIKYGRDRIDHAVVARCTWDSSLEGKSIAQINAEKGRRPVLEDEIETVIEMVGKGGAQMVYHLMNEADVVRILEFRYTMVASDGGVIEFGRGAPHPRSYGTNARVLGRYVREQGVLRLEDAIRKMTSLPAQRFRLADRGLVRPGMWADLVVFDPAKVADRATFEKPHAYSEGFQYVLVNGEVVIVAAQHTGARSGKILLGPAAQ